MEERAIESDQDKDVYNARNPLIKFFHNQRLNEVAKMVKPKGKILDVGCGEGFFLIKVKGKRFGIDPLEEKLIKAKEKNKTFLLVKSDASKLPFKSRTFDTVVCSEVLEHVKDYRKAIKEIKRVAKDSGEIVISAPNETNLRLGRLFVLRFPLRVPAHLNRFTPKEIESLFGLEIRETKKVPFPFYRLCLSHITKFRKTAKKRFT